MCTTTNLVPLFVIKSGIDIKVLQMKTGWIIQNAINDNLYLCPLSQTYLEENEMLTILIGAQKWNFNVWHC